MYMYHISSARGTDIARVDRGLIIVHDGRAMEAIESARRVVALGSTAREQGRSLGAAAKDKIHELYEPDWKAWFGDEGGERDGGPDDPRLALIVVDAEAVHYMKAKHGKARTLFEIAKGMATGSEPDIGREEHLSGRELR